MSIKDKLLSRKFWLCAAAFLGSIGTSIAGIKTDSNVVVATGIICAVLSSAIYAACEAYVDKAAVINNTVAEDVEDGD